MNPKILVIGCGSIGERHLRCFQRTGRAEPVACEPRAEVLQRIKTTYNVAGFATLEGAWAGGRYDAVVICAPAQMHIAMATDCLKRGLHLLIEKPLSISLDGVDDLLQAVAASGKFVRVGYTWHFHPGVKALRDCLKRRELGVSQNGGFHFADRQLEPRITGTPRRLEQLGAHGRQHLPVVTQRIEIALGNPAAQVAVDVLKVLGRG